jgi:short-subunit dehydrogenase
MNKWALITGASGGIGAEMAKILGEQNYHMVLVDQTENGLEQLAASMAKSNSKIRILTMVIDLCEDDAAEKVYRRVKSEAINLEILINNAGFGTLGYFSKIDWQREQRMIRLHVETLTLLTKLFLSEMLKAGQGKILNVASVAAFRPSPLMAVYNATKAYILSFSEAISNEVKGSGVSVTVLCPGLTRTGFQKNVGVGSPDFTKNRWLSDGAEKVARSGIKAMHAGKAIVIPGILNNLLITIQRILPRSMITSLMRKVQEKNRRFLTAMATVHKIPADHE